MGKASSQRISGPDRHSKPLNSLLELITSRKFAGSEVCFICSLLHWEIMEGNHRYEVCTSLQIRAIAGLMTLALTAAASAYELPSMCEFVLIGGGAAAWSLAIICAFLCYFVKHERARHEGPGQLCPVCNSPAEEGSYHCELCGVCVAGFSHHSEWLNSCIGRANYPAYLGCLAGMGLAGGFQVAAYLALFIVMVQDKETMIRINEKYSMMDQGYIFHLILYFTLMVSVTLAATNCTNLIIRIWRVMVRRLEKPNKQRAIFPMLSPPLQLVASSEAPIYTISVSNSFDTHTLDITNGMMSALPFSS